MFDRGISALCCGAALTALFAGAIYRSQNNFAEATTVMVAGILLLQINNCIRYSKRGWGED